MNIHHLVGVSEDFGFVFLDPGHLVDGGGDADGCDTAAVCRRELGEHLLDGCAVGFPPADGVVLVLVHRGGVQLNVLLRRVPDVSFCVDDDRLRGCRRRVDCDDEGTVCQILVLGHDAFASPVNDNC